MKKLICACLLLVSSGTSAHALPFNIPTTQGLEFVDETRIPGPSGQMMSLCYVTEDLEIFGLRLISNIQSYALATDRCTNGIDQLYSEEQMIAAQSLDLVSATLDPVAKNDWRRNFMFYGLFTSAVLALIAIIIRRVKSLMGLDLRGAMRKKAAHRILLAMCHVAKCDGIVASAELTHLRETAKRLTGRNFPTTEIIHMVDAIDMAVGLGVQDFIAFGKGLRDREKDLMMQGVLSVAIASGRIMPTEYAFATELAYGLGMPGEDFRRVLNAALSEMDA